ncbi:hypothetical protein E4U43_001713 [Claviceps pusilla]|uniref:Uncharacterized protein n=1 Tax=Claviceps pusilla TaxID=123648 RepID=A0A9P7N8I4_9HYPO|nr:hypothetical protein E4U43_001713 [Claviceps pusilla]
MALANGSRMGISSSAAKLPPLYEHPVTTGSSSRLGSMSTLMGRDTSFIVMNSKQESRTETLRRASRNPI